MEVAFLERSRECQTWDETREIRREKKENAEIETVDGQNSAPPVEGERGEKDVEMDPPIPPKFNIASISEGLRGPCEWTKFCTTCLLPIFGLCNIDFG